MSKEFREAVRRDFASQLIQKPASNSTDPPVPSQLQPLPQSLGSLDGANDARAALVAIAVRSKPNESAPKPPFSHVALSRTSSSEGNSTKRIAIDLTLSSDEDDDIKPALKKARNVDRHVVRNDVNHRSAGIQVVIPPRSSATISISAEQLWKHNHGKNLSKVAKSKYAERLLQIPGPRVTLYNDIDDSTPSTDFKFINDYVFSYGTKRIDKEFHSGCTCREENGRSIGCEYLYCECIDDSARDENGELYGFPYYATGQKKGTLREMFLKTRYAIYECNELCNCDENCKTRVVQKGRQLPLEIFKTRNRGWGLRSPKAIRKGKFIDTYLGEVITDAEATRREDAAIKGKDSYLYSLDKFQGIEGEPDYIPSEELYVVDGEFMGGPTRFINHSCDPNCRQFVVSMVRGDSKVYELAFFALEAISAYTELTFDYLDKDEDDDDEEELVNEHNVKELEAKKDRLATKCLCGSANCRKYLWL